MKPTAEWQPGPVPESTAVADALDAEQVAGAVIDGLRLVVEAAAPVVGTARTATVINTDEPGIPGAVDLLDGVSAGDVLVLGWQAEPFISIFGGLAATRSASLGCLALVTDGWVRDLEEIQHVGLWVWANGTTPRSGKGRLAVVGIGEPTTVSGASVSNGDLVVVDGTGLTIVSGPDGDRDQVLRTAADLQERDAAFREAMLAGRSFGAARDLAKTM